MKTGSFPLVALLLPACLLGQSLGEVAQKEKERRKQVEAAASPAPVFGNDSLATTKGQIASDPGAPIPPPDHVQGPQGMGDEAAWRARYRAAAARLEKAQIQLQKVVVLPRMTAAGNPLEKAKAAVTDAQKALDDLSEEARKAGIPPGWVRP
jgi:hypothetical protein